MRMISRRDERIIGELSRYAGNDMRIVRRALNELNAEAIASQSKIRMDEAKRVIERIRKEEEVAEEAI